MHRERYIGIASILGRSGRLMTITYVGWYHMVLIKPPNRPLGAVCRVRNVESVTLKGTSRAVLRRSLSALWTSSNPHESYTLIRTFKSRRVIH